MARSKNKENFLDVWPGFVDAISTLLLLFVFMMALFSVVSFSLGETLSGKKREISGLETQVSEISQELKKLNAQKNELLKQLSELVGIEADIGQNEQEVIDQVSRQILALKATRDKLLLEVTQLKVSNLSLKENIKKKELHEIDLNKTIAALTQDFEEAQSELNLKSQAQINAEAEIIMLSEQIQSLTASLQTIESILEEKEKAIKEKDIEIANLGNRINQVLASEVNQLQAYRSEFFGRLKEKLGENSDIKIEGDRFVISSGVLFNSASAELGEKGLESVNNIATIIKQIDKEIPQDISWIIRVDGHTDNIPYQGSYYKDNWELSSARALSVVYHLIEKGIPPERLVSAGFGEFHPINKGRDADALAQNRRIEIKLTQK